jgi:hypothetical protein
MPVGDWVGVSAFAEAGFARETTETSQADSGEGVISIVMWMLEIDNVTTLLLVALPKVIYGPVAWVVRR